MNHIIQALHSMKLCSITKNILPYYLITALSENKCCGTLLIWYESVIHVNNIFINYLIFSKEYLHCLSHLIHIQALKENREYIYNKTQLREGKCLVLCVYGRAEIKPSSTDFKSFVQCTRPKITFIDSIFCARSYTQILYYLICN